MTFHNCLTKIPFDSTNTDDVLDGWNTSAVTTMRSAFEGCAAMEGSIKQWDVSNVKDMSLMVRSFLSALLRFGDASLEHNTCLHQLATTSQLSLVFLLSLQFAGASSFGKIYTMISGAPYPSCSLIINSYEN